MTSKQSFVVYFFLILQMKIDDILNDLEANDFGDLVSGHYYHFNIYIIYLFV